MMDSNAKYYYRCVNEKCQSYRITVVIEKPIKYCTRNEYCAVCQKGLERFF